MMDSVKHCMLTIMCFQIITHPIGSIIFEKGKHFRLIKKINIKPYKQYRISVSIKTQNVSNPQSIRALVMPDGRSGIHLNLSTFDIEATQDWKKHSVVFNSQDFEEVYFYLGAWGPKSGAFWVDNVEVNECLGRKPCTTVTAAR